MPVFEKVQEIIVEELGKTHQVTTESTFWWFGHQIHWTWNQVISEIEDAFDIKSKQKMTWKQLS